MTIVLCWLKQEVESGSIKWLIEPEDERPPVDRKPRCANGTNRDDITWDCEQGKMLKISGVD